MKAAETIWDAVRQHIEHRAQWGKPVGGLAMALERLIASELDALGAEAVERVIERVDVGYQVLLALAQGDRPDGELLEERVRMGKTLPQRQPGRSDPTERQATALLALRRIDGGLRRIAVRHGIELPGAPPRRADVGPDIAELAEQFLEAGWTAQQVDDELRSVGVLADTMRITAAGVRRQIQQRCRVCQCHLRDEIDVALRGGYPQREIETWLREEGLDISQSTISRHRGHMDEPR